MSLFLHILIGLIVVIIGVVTLKYNFQLVNTTGNVGVFEKYLGAGGTFAGFKLLSVLAILLGFLYMTSLFDIVLGFLLSPLTNALKSGQSATQ